MKVRASSASPRQLAACPRSCSRQSQQGRRISQSLYHLFQNGQALIGLFPLPDSEMSHAFHIENISEKFAQALIHSSLDSYVFLFRPGSRLAAENQPDRLLKNSDGRRKFRPVVTALAQQKFSVNPEGQTVRPLENFRDESFCLRKFS